MESSQNCGNLRSRVTKLKEKDFLPTTEIIVEFDTQFIRRDLKKIL